MIKKISIIFFCMILLSSSSVLGYKIQSFNTEIDVYTDGVAKVVNELIIDTTNIKETFSIPAYSPESIIVKDVNGELKFANLGENIIIQPRKRIEEYNVLIQYLTNTLTSKKGNDWSLNYLIPAYKKINVEKIENAGLILSLPNTATINNFTEGGIIFTENSNLKIGWKLVLEETEDINIEIKYNNKIKREINYTKIAFYLLSSIILLFIIFFGIRRGYCKIAKRITKGKKDIMKTLDTREKDVINLLLQNKNQLYQSKIQKDTNINKATLSRVIKRLESKNIIEVMPSGNTNLIIIQNWFAKK